MSSTEELVAALDTTEEFNFELPDPEDDNITDYEFQAQLDQVWKICDRFDLQTEIWRGRVLRAIRDREKKGGEGRGEGFLNWLKKNEISKTQAYKMIQLANSADELLAEGKLNPDSINNFSKGAFIETAAASPEVQQLVSEAADKGERITRREVKELADQWTTMTSELLPPEAKQKADEGTISPRHLAPLVKELEKLPESHMNEIYQEVASNPDVDTIKTMTTEARNLSKYIDAASQVQTVKDSMVDVEMALEEALRLDCLNTAADVLKQAQNLEQTVTKLFTTWKRLGTLCDRLYVDTGASSPNLRALLTSLEILSQPTIEVKLDDAGTNRVRLKIMKDE